MFGLKSYLYVGLGVAALSAAAWVYALQAANARKSAEILRLGNELRVIAEVSERNAEARDVARAETNRFAKDALAYAALKEDILKGGGDEKPADPTTIAVVERLRGRTAN